MSGIMSVFSNMFGSQAPVAPATPGVQAPANTPGSIPPTAPNTGAVAPSTAPNGVIPVAPKPDATPLDQFADLWKNEPTDPNAPQSAGIFGNVDPKKFMEAAGKIDFTKVVTPEQLQQITAGGEDAMKAFASALNSVAQTTYAQSAFAATKITEQAVNRARDSFLAELPQHIKKQVAGDSLRKENPVFSNPAVAPIISALESQLAVKYPQASSNELTEMAKKYVEALGTSFGPKPQSPQDTSGIKGSKDFDWDAYLTN